MKKLLAILLCVIGTLNVEAQELKTVLIDGLWYWVYPENRVAEVIKQSGNLNVDISSKNAKSKLIIPDVITYYPDMLSGTGYECAVVAIGQKAFYGYENITEVVLPKHLFYIGEMAFGGCKKLKSITLPDNLHVINQQAFWECTSLKSIVIPESLEQIGSGAFDRCKNLKKIVWNAVNCELISYENKEINIFAEDGAYVPPFISCENVTDVTFGPNVERIPRLALADLKKLKALTIPQSVKEIGESAFYNCPKLKKVRFENSLGASMPREYWFKGTPAEIESVLMPGESVSIH